MRGRGGGGMKSTLGTYPRASSGASACRVRGCVNWDTHPGQSRPHWVHFEFAAS